MRIDPSFFIRFYHSRYQCETSFRHLLSFLVCYFIIRIEEEIEANFKYYVSMSPKR